MNLLWVNYRCIFSIVPSEYFLMYICVSQMKWTAKLVTYLKDGKKPFVSSELFNGNFVSNYRNVTVGTTSQNISFAIIDVSVQPLILGWSKSKFSCQYHALKKINTDQPTRVNVCTCTWKVTNWIQVKII